MVQENAHPKGRIKGAIIREFMCWYEDQIGHPAFAARFGGDAYILNASRGGGILASKWYDAEDIHRCFDALSNAHPPKELQQIIKEGTQVSVANTFNTLHRTLIRGVASPFLHARFVQVLWGAYYDTGKITSERVDKYEQLITYRNWASHHPVLCGIIRITDEVLFPMMGLKNVRVTGLQCVSTGADACAHSITWTD